MSRIPTIAFSALTLWAASLSVIAAPDTYSDKPDSSAISCREVREPNMALIRPNTVCKRNSDWARINAGFAGAGPDGAGYPSPDDHMPSGNLSQPH